MKVIQAESREDKKNNNWTVTSGFRLQRGSAYNNFSFGLKIHKIDNDRFTATFFMFLGKTFLDPKVRLPK